MNLIQNKTLEFRNTYTLTQCKKSAKIINNRLLYFFKIFISYYKHIVHLFEKRSHFKDCIPKKECVHDCRIQDIKLLHRISEVSLCVF